MDDSTVFRSQIRTALEGIQGIEVVGFATDGKMAIESLKHKKVDLVTLDLEMPVMDGLQTLEELNRLKIRPHILVFSAHTKRGAESTLSALQAGASDFLLKPQLDASSGKSPAEVIREVLLPKIDQFRDKRDAPSVAPTPMVVTPTIKKFPPISWASFNPQVVVVASSTGGPNALEQFVSRISNPLNCPILIAQHMPPIFTMALAERLQKISGLPVHEAKHMMPVQKGHIYIAPGDYHMSIAMSAGEPVVILDQEPLRNSVRPAADFLFESATRVYRNAVLGIVLTGMGSDGKDGALAIKENGGAILIQDKNSCVVFGMPGAVFSENAFDHMSDIEGIVRRLGELSLCQFKKAG